MYVRWFDERANEGDCRRTGDGDRQPAPGNQTAAAERRQPGDEGSCTRAGVILPSFSRRAPGTGAMAASSVSSGSRASFLSISVDEKKKRVDDARRPRTHALCREYACVALISVQSPLLLSSSSSLSLGSLEPRCRNSPASRAASVCAPRG